MTTLSTLQTEEHRLTLVSPTDLRQVEGYSSSAPGEAEAIANLRAEIAACGQLEAIVVCRSRVVTGRRRYQACVDLGIEILVMVRDDLPDDPELHRRLRTAENVSRGTATMSERVELRAVLEPVLELAAIEAKSRGGSRGMASRYGIGLTGGNLPPVSEASAAASALVASGRVPDAMMTRLLGEPGKMRDKLARELHVDLRQLDAHDELLSLRTSVAGDPAALEIVDRFVAKSDRLANTAGRQLNAARSALESLGRGRPDEEVPVDGVRADMEQLVSKCTLAASFVQRTLASDRVAAVALMAPQHVLSVRAAVAQAREQLDQVLAALDSATADAA